MMAHTRHAMLSPCSRVRSRVFPFRARFADDFQVDLGLFAQRDIEQRAALEAAQANVEEMTQGEAAAREALAAAEARDEELSAEIEALHAAADEHANLADRAEAERREAAARAEAAEAQIGTMRHERASAAEAAQAQRTGLTAKLEAASGELRQANLEKERLAATLEEALGRCTASLVAKRLAEDESRALQMQLEKLAGGS